MLNSEIKKELDNLLTKIKNNPKEIDKTKDLTLFDISGLIFHNNKAKDILKDTIDKGNNILYIDDRIGLDKTINILKHTNGLSDDIISDNVKKNIEFVISIENKNMITQEIIDNFLINEQKEELDNLIKHFEGELLKSSSLSFANREISIEEYLKVLSLEDKYNKIERLTFIISGIILDFINKKLHNELSLTLSTIDKEEYIKSYLEIYNKIIENSVYNDIYLNKVILSFIILLSLNKIGNKMNEKEELYLFSPIIDNSYNNIIELIEYYYIDGLLIEESKKEELRKFIKSDINEIEKFYLDNKNNLDTFIEKDLVLNRLIDIFSNLIYVSLISNIYTYIIEFKNNLEISFFDYYTDFTKLLESYLFSIFYQKKISNLTLIMEDELIFHNFLQNFIKIS